MVCLNHNTNDLGIYKAEDRRGNIYLLLIKILPERSSWVFHCTHGVGQSNVIFYSNAICDYYVLVVEPHIILGSGYVSGVGYALPLTVEGLNAKFWVSLFRERHESLNEEGNIHIIAFGFYNSKAEVEVDGANEVSDFWWRV
jgi:hypothetical protein